MTSIRLFPLVLPLVALATPAVASPAEIEDALAARLDQSEVSFFVFLDQQADLSPADAIRGKEAKGRFVFDALTEVAARTQAPLVAALRRESVELRPFWIANMIWVRGPPDLVTRMAAQPDVARVLDSPEVTLVDPRDGAAEAVARRAIEWNITQVHADQVWAEGVTGQGVTVAGLDTGVQWDHAALIEQYRGWNGTTAVHDHHWHDAAHVSSDPCGGDSPVPCDSHGHGTHITGTMVGDDGGANRIGMAPDAEWIHCRLWEPDLASDIAYVVECLQWTLAPTDLNDENPDPALAPHVVSNSWICEPSEGCVDPDAILPVVQSLRAAGIVVVAGAGNNGPACSSSRYPPGIHEGVVSVGATDRFDVITDFSSRGPVTIDGSGRLKPNVCAPGLEVRSAFPPDTYFSWAGTSMATPHVSGLVALLISANPDLAGEVDAIGAILEETALGLTTTQSCGGVPGSEIPNHTYGYGRIDAYAAYLRALEHVSGTPEAAAAPRVRLSGAPNPSAAGTVVRFELAEGGPVTLRVFDVAGRRVRTLAAARPFAAGPHERRWNGRDDSGRALAAGTYFVHLEAGGRRVTRRVTLVR